jgi:Matrixin
MGGTGGGGCSARAVCLLAASTLAGCGGRGDSGLSPSLAPRSVQLLSGDDGAPVAGASVRIGTRTAVADAQGRITVEAWDAEALDVEAAGFLPRQTSLGQADRFTLWPVGPSYPEAYVRRLLYTAAGRSAQDQPLRRPVASSVSVVLSDELQRDAEASSAHRRAAGLLTEATAGAVRFDVELTPRREVVFQASLDASGGSEGALTYRTLKGDAIVGGRITFSHPRYARDVRFVAHELGHALGLQHSLDARDMMYSPCGADCAEAFSDRERLTIRLLLQRRPGNTYPDRDRAFSAASLGGTSIVVD